MKLVNVRRAKCTHYVGRGAAPSGIGTGLGNPFPVGAYKSRAAAIQAFEHWARTHPDVLAIIKRLPEHAVLGCWCAPQACHGEIIIKLWRELQCT